MSVIRFIPVYDRKVWGGRSLEKMGRVLPDGRIGESREVFDFPDESSVVASGKYAGETFRSVLEKHPSEIMGAGWNPKDPFPIVVKLLDCRRRLSLQVHPSEAAARKLSSRKKSEAWYFLKSSGWATYESGIRAGESRETLLGRIKDFTLEKTLISYKSSEGDFIFIPAGVLHGTGAGNIILEIGENSDYTYRVYDWGRLDLNGEPRKLHIEEALESVDLEPTRQPVPVSDGGETSCELVNAREFRICRRALKNGETFAFGAQEQPRLVSVVKGSLLSDDGVRVSEYETVLLPYCDSAVFKALKDSVMIITDGFAGNF